MGYADTAKHGRRVVVPDRLGVAWEAFRALSASERREFINLLRDWHLQRRIEAVAARGGSYGPRPPQSLLAGVSVGEMASAFDRDADDLKNIGL
jgi:hypothetical protein